jgi:hypothetical protein
MYKARIVASKLGHHSHMRAVWYAIYAWFVASCLTGVNRFTRLAVPRNLIRRRDCMSTWCNSGALRGSHQAHVATHIYNSVGGATCVRPNSASGASLYSTYLLRSMMYINDVYKRYSLTACCAHASERDRPASTVTDNVEACGASCTHRGRHAHIIAIAAVIWVNVKTFM